MTKKILLGIKKEDDSSENRVSIVPKDIQTIINLGVDVLVEKNAGAKSGYTDEEYSAAGAKIVTKFPSKTDIVTSVNAFYNPDSNFIKDTHLQYNRIDPNKKFENFVIPPSKIPSKLVSIKIWSSGSRRVIVLL